MLRLTLLTMVFVSCVGVGMYLGGIYGFRLDDLKRFKKGLLILRSDIDHLGTPLQEALHNLALKLGQQHQVSQLFAHTAAAIATQQFPDQALNESLAHHQHRLYLSPEDHETLRAFGQTLGYLDKHLQLESIALTVAYLDERIAQETANRLKYTKLYQTLGVLAGLLVLVLFI